MNIYFLVEDEGGLFKILPIWLDFINSGYRQVPNIQSMSTNTYFMDTGRGIQRLVDEGLNRAINKIINNPGKVDLLVVIADSEEKSANERKKIIYDAIENNYPEMWSLDFRVRVFICECCFETWLLGDKKLHPSQVDPIVFPKHEYKSYYNFYDISKLDPTFMPRDVTNTISSTRARYHYQYLHKATLYLKKLRQVPREYSKTKIDSSQTIDYLEALRHRVGTTNHINGFSQFYQFLINI